MIHIPALLISLHIILFNQLLDILLDIPHIQHTSTLGLLNDLRNQLGMTDRLAALHDPDNRRLRLKLPVRCDSFVSFLVLRLRLARLDLIDLDAVLWVCEGVVDGEDVIFLNVFTFGGFVEDSVARAGQRLERALELVIILGNVSFNRQEISLKDLVLTKAREGLQIGVRNRFSAVKCQQNDRLEGADNNLLVSLWECGSQLAMG